MHRNANFHDIRFYHLPSDAELCRRSWECQCVHVHENLTKIRKNNWQNRRVTWFKTKLEEAINTYNYHVQEQGKKID